MEPFPESWRMRSNRMDEPAKSNQGYLHRELLAQNNVKQSKLGDKRKSVILEEGKEENPEALLDRRLTIHCIVEEITSLEENSWRECSHNCAAKNKCNRENNKWWYCECRNIEMNSCVVIKASTNMCDLVKTVLAKLGYPSNASLSATGSILIRNWKALSLSTICPSPKMTVGDILGELSSLVTLQIQILRPKSAFVQEMKDRLLNFLITKSHSSLVSSGCPLDLLMLTKLCEESGYSKKNIKEDSMEEMHQRFEAWLNHAQKSDIFNREINHFASLSVNNSEDNNNSNGNSNVKNSSNGEINRKFHNNTHASNSISSSSSALSGESQSQSVSDNELVKQNAENRIMNPASPSFESSERSERTLNCVQAKTRMRTSFDPDLELPKLLKWYLENPHPTRQQIHEYVQELNCLESRRGRKKLDMNNVVYWFKNARAAQKRSEYRKFCNIPVPGSKKNCNVLKIPLGKTSSSVTSEEHMTLSDEEPCVVTENVNTFRNGKGKCMQVLGNWNSNGAGEAVLEMRIAPPKTSESSSPIKVEEEQLTDQEESSAEGMLSIAEESMDNAEGNPADENRSGELNEMIESRKPFDQENPDIKEELKFRKSEEEVRGEVDAPEDKSMQDDLGNVKSRNKSNLTTQRKSNGLSHSETSLLSRYKTAHQNSILRHSFLYMSQCMNAKLNNIPLSSEERRKRNRTFIDPLTEVPRLEQWFQLSTHPSHSLIVRYTEELNGMPYRKKFPKLETKNVQFWFKNRRAKNKRLNYLDTNNFLR